MSKPREPAVRILWPTLETPQPGRDCYCARAVIQKWALEHGFSRAWRVNGEITSLQRRDGSFLKNIDAFPDHQHSTDAFYGMLDECFRRQCFRPTAYHDPVYADISMPRVKWTVNGLFAPQFAGGWNAALTTGLFSGLHMVYDLQSAYLSALLYGLPDPATYRHSDNPRDGGLYVVDIEPNPASPYPFNTFPRVNATADEIEVYSLKVRRIVSGIRWSRDWRANQLFSSIRDLSFWKQAGRMYWGRWAMTDRVEMIGGNTGEVTQLRSVFTNLPWSHLILSRIRMRLFEEVQRGDVRHVFTDSIITTNPRRTGRKGELGSWKLVKVYPPELGGIYIKAAGQYGGAFNEYLDKHAGTPVAKRGAAA